MEKYHTLTVYRASAGSGKTFTLAIRFIELLISNPYAYRETLAVTFTNKATEEMKTRILSQLYGIANSLPDSEKYLKRITDDLGCSRQEIRHKAGVALSLMLHDYSRFNIETIDAFFQRVLRNLAHELELSANLRVELDNEEVEEMAVDKLIAELKQNDSALKCIIGYIEQEMEDDKDWNVISDIKDFGKKVFKREYKDNAEALNAKLEASDDFFERYKRSLRNVIREADESMKQIADDFFRLLDENGYATGDFIYSANGGPTVYFRKLQEGNYLDKRNSSVFNSRAQKAAEGFEGWVKKDDFKKPIAAFAETTLVPFINKAEAERSRRARHVATAQAIMKNINELRLLNDIDREVREINKEGNRFLLDDTQNLLNELLESTDAPFVFEKIGGRIRNIMIDEFQDTSTIQWANFKKLLLECMSHEGSENLIVGDVKQSIYRWRNGDWRLLNNIDADSDLQGKDVWPDKLHINRRSEINIVKFNNRFFLAAAPQAKELLKEDGNDKGAIIEQIYDKDLVEQEWPKDKEPHGLVDITLLSPAQGETYEDVCYPMVKEQILLLAANGARDEDIAILSHDNREIARLANWLQNEIPDHTFISDEAYKLDSSMAVNILVDALKVLSDPGNCLLKSQLAKEYRQCVLGEEVPAVSLGGDNGADKFLPFEFVNNRERLLSLPPSDLADTLFVLFNLHRLSEESAYVDAFMDQLSAFTKNNTPDIGRFLEAWDDTLHEKSVKGGDLQGVRLLTIHKSKGLEFDHVIVPYAAWTLDKGSTLWCKTDEAPFSEMPVVPVESGGLKNTVYSEDWFTEQVQNSIDNMNLLYVTFTRAAKNLFVIGKNVRGRSGLNKSTMCALIQKTLPKVTEDLPGSVLTGDPKKAGETLHFTYGSLYVKNQKEEKSRNVFLQAKTGVAVDADVHNLNLEFRQSNRSRSFVADTDSQPENSLYITQGTVMHSVLSRIHDASEVERVLNDFVQEGIISDSDETMNRNSLSKLIRKRITDNPHAEVNRWFSADAEVFNECTIISTDPETGAARELRPDRVVKTGDTMTVIDFKFGKPNERYKSQVRTYMNLLTDMGYAHVEGYLWYIYNNKVEPVAAND
jgi:ATP-dependent exoDNAse (exonuclease V) beta subunit